MNINPYSYKDDQGNWTNGKIVYVNEIAMKKLIECSDDIELQRVYSYCVYLRLIDKEITAENICKEMGVDQDTNYLDYSRSNPYVDEFQIMKIKVEKTIDELVRHKFLERKLDYTKQRRRIGEGNPKRITISDLASILHKSVNESNEEIDNI